MFYRTYLRILLFPQQSEKQKALKSSRKHFHLPAIERRGGGYWLPCKVFGVWGKATTMQCERPDHASVVRDLTRTAVPYFVFLWQFIGKPHKVMRAAYLLVWYAVPEGYQYLIKALFWQSSESALYWTF